MEVFAPVDLLLETKAAGSLGNVLCGVAAYLGKSFMLYQKVRDTVSNFQAYGISGNSLSAKTSDSITLSGYHFWPKEVENPKDLPTVIFFHENAGTLSQRFQYFADYVKTCQCSLVVFGYRGYSKSPGHPSYQGLIKDAEAILTKVFTGLPDKINTQKVILHGKSLGGGVASLIASEELWKDKVSGVILDSTFNSLGNLVSHYIKSLKPASEHIFINEKWEVLDCALRFNPDKPVLVIGVVGDEICPYSHSLKLHEELSSLKRNATLVTFEEGGHNDYCYEQKEKYFGNLKSFLENLN